MTPTWLLWLTPFLEEVGRWGRRVGREGEGRRSHDRPGARADPEAGSAGAYDDAAVRPWLHTDAGASDDGRSWRAIHPLRSTWLLAPYSRNTHYSWSPLPLLPERNSFWSSSGPPGPDACLTPGPPPLSPSPGRHSVLPLRQRKVQQHEGDGEVAPPGGHVQGQVATVVGHQPVGTVGQKEPGRGSQEGARQYV